MNLKSTLWPLLCLLILAACSEEEPVSKKASSPEPAKLQASDWDTGAYTDCPSCPPPGATGENGDITLSWGIDREAGSSCTFGDNYIRGYHIFARKNDPNVGSSGNQTNGNPSGHGDHLIYIPQPGGYAKGSTYTQKLSTMGVTPVNGDTWYFKMLIEYDEQGFVCDTYTRVWSGDPTFSATVGIQAPSNFTMTGASNYGLSYSWNAVAGASEYKICASTTNGFNLATAANDGQNTYCQITSNTTVSFNDMLGATTYYARVAVYDSGSSSIGLLSSQLSNQPTKPTAGSPSLSTPDNYSLGFSWGAISGTTNYRLYVSTNGSFNPATLVHSPPNNYVVDMGTLTSHTISNMLGGVTYYSRLDAFDGVQQGYTSSQSSRATTLPAATGLTSPSQDDGSLTYGWNSAAGANNYRITIDNNSDFSSPISSVDKSTSTSHTFTGLTNGTNYYARVSVYENGTSGAYSTTGPHQPKEPDIQNFTGTPGDNTITYNWNNATSGITTYRLFVSNSTPINTANIAHSPPFSFVVDLSNVTSHTLTVENGKNYYAKIGTWNGSLGDLSSTGPHMSTPTLGEGYRNYLNDTGIKLYADNTTNNNLSALAEFLGQDAGQGRESVLSGVITKAFDLGEAAFDFTKLGGNGTPLSNQLLSWDNSGSEAASTQWSCVRDNISGLTWQVLHSANGTFGELLNDADDRFTWYNNDSNENGGNSGSQDRGSTCYGYTGGVAASYCNTEAFVARINAANLCNRSDWRLPSKDELNSIVNYAALAPAIDSSVFPDTPATSSYWTSTPYTLDSSQAWTVKFEQGTGAPLRKRVPAFVRLVAGTAIVDK